VPYLRLTPQLIKCLDFTPFEDKEGLGERRGSLDERHRERVRSVDQLVEKSCIYARSLLSLLDSNSNRHDTFSELMATSIVPELIYFYIPLGWSL
jgi:hypothetical protein